MKLFWGCFLALITTSTAFITRAILISTPDLWPKDFGLSPVSSGELFGAGLWPFAITIILFSFFIDKVGYKAAMFFSAVCYVIYGVMVLNAYSLVHPGGGALTGEALTAAQGKAWPILYWGSVILGLGNGTVEAFANPVVATLFNREKVKWINTLHAGWPAGLVLGGVITILLDQVVKNDWRIVVYLLGLPAIVYLVMLAPAKFPVQERVASGTTYREMLAEFGVVGAMFASYMIFRELQNDFKWDGSITLILVAASAVAYGLYARSLGRPLMIVFCLIMTPLAITELGTDGAIGGLMMDPMEKAGLNPAWVLVYTSAIMMVLRFFFAGPLVARLTPLGLLAGCTALAIVGLNLLAVAKGLAFIFIAASIYGVGKSFFWPTTLGIVSEQFPKGGALTLNAIAGIGMLSVGIIGSPLIGRMQEASWQHAIEAKSPGTYQKVAIQDTYVLGNYSKVDPKAITTLPPTEQGAVTSTEKDAKQGALSAISILPVIMLVSYIGLLLYFKSQGGYKAVYLNDAESPAGH
ncbi:MFS transporter [bacterium]|nr:MAG: MFS transporter [bacterium]